MWDAKSKAFCRRFHLDYPIIQAPMAGGITTVDLMVAVCQAGGLGSLGAGYLSPLDLERTIIAIKERTDRPYAVNLFIPNPAPNNTPNNTPNNKPNKAPHHCTPKTPLTAQQKSLIQLADQLGVPEFSLEPTVSDFFQEQMAVIIDHKVPILSYTFGTLPKHYQALLKQQPIKTIASANCVQEAVILAATGCDAIVAQGFEAGGHRAGFMSDPPASIGLMALVPQLSDAVDIPVIAAGGIMDGRGIMAALHLGASAVQMGSAFLGAKEARVNTGYVTQLQNSQDQDSLLTTAFSGKWARSLGNAFTRLFADDHPQIAPYPQQHYITAPIRAAAAAQGLTDYQSLWAGQAASMVQCSDAASLIKRWVQEVHQQLASVGAVDLS